MLRSYFHVWDFWVFCYLLLMSLGWKPTTKHENDWAISFLFSLYISDLFFFFTFSTIISFVTPLIYYSDVIKNVLVLFQQTGGHLEAGVQLWVEWIRVEQGRGRSDPVLRRSASPRGSQICAWSRIQPAFVSPAGFCLCRSETSSPLLQPL